MTLKLHAACLILGLAGMASMPAVAQSNWPSPPQSAQQMPEMHRDKQPDLAKLQQAAEQHKAQLQKDTQRLGQLVTELRQELDKTPAGTLSLSAVKKSKQIEKLAKRVRKEMEGD